MPAVTPDVDVVTRVKALAAHEARPALTEAEVLSAIQANPRQDAEGRTADLEDWTPTWDINAAVAELWRIKAAKVAGDFNFSADDARFDKGAVLANCLEMEARYASMAAGSANTGPGYVDLLKGVVVNG